jgi:hypothetical protein
MFPGPHAEIHYNEAGEPIGWDNHYDDQPEVCGICGGAGHSEFDCFEDFEEEIDEGQPAYNDMLQPGGYLLTEEES